MATLVCAPTTQRTLWIGDFFQPFSGPVLGTAPTNLYTSQYPTIEAQSAGRVQFLSDTPPPGCAWYARYTIDDSDLNGVSTNPRCQLQGPFDVSSGDTVRFYGWIRMNYRPSFSTGFFLIMEVFNHPFYQSPQIALNIDTAGNVVLKTEQLHTSPYYFNLWSKPLVVGTWMYFSITALMSTSNTTGWLTFDYANDGTANTSAQSMTLGSQSGTQITMQTLNEDTSGNTGSAGLYATLYRTRGLESVSHCDYAGFGIEYIS